MRVAVVGTGYVGLVTGACLAEVGHNVVCIDIDGAKIAALRQGKSPIYEPGIEAMIGRNSAQGRLDFSTDLQSSLHGCIVVFIAVGTPEGQDGSADLSVVKAVARDIGRFSAGPLLVVVKSTVPVGTCDQVQEILRGEYLSRGLDWPIQVASNPEFLKEGAAIEDFMRPERIIAGTDDKDSREVFEEIYRPFILDDPGKLMFMSCRASELTKYASNAMLATRISFMNELSILCERVGANIDEIRRGMGADTRIGKKFLYAGPGYGGSCFPKDVEALIISARSRGIQLSVLESVQSANRAQKKLMVQKVLNYFGEGISGKRIAVWGLAFKPGTDDVREAPALTIVRKLVESGATIVAHDPQAMTTFSKAYGESNRLIYADDAYSALEGADAMVLITEWSAYKRPDWDRVIKLLAKPVVFDFRNQYSFTSLTKLGIHYQCVGRPDSTVFQDGKTCY